jgi:hypothetical protein
MNKLQRRVFNAFLTGILVFVVGMVLYLFGVTINVVQYLLYIGVGLITTATLLSIIYPAEKQDQII